MSDVSTVIYGVLAFPMGKPLFTFTHRRQSLNLSNLRCSALFFVHCDHGSFTGRSYTHANTYTHAGCSLNYMILGLIVFWHVSSVGA